MDYVSCIALSSMATLLADTGCEHRLKQDTVSVVKYRSSIDCFLRSAAQGKDRYLVVQGKCMK